MEVKVHIPFNELLTVVKQLSSAQKIELQKELTRELVPVDKQSGLTKLLLSGPVFTEEQIRDIEETHKSVNQWRTKPF